MPKVMMLQEAPVEGRLRARGDEVDVSDDCARLLYRSGQAAPAPPKLVSVKDQAKPKFVK